MRANLNFLFAVLIVIAISSLALLTRSCGHPPVPPFFDRSVTLEEAGARSMRSGRPVLALVSADWCAPCAELKRGALADPRIAAWITQNTEPVYIDMTRVNGRDAAGQAIIEQLRVNAYPSIVITSQGKYIAGVEGAIPADDLLKWFQKVRSDLDGSAAGG